MQALEHSRAENLLSCKPTTGATAAYHDVKKRTAAPIDSIVLSAELKKAPRELELSEHRPHFRSDIAEARSPLYRGQAPHQRTFFHYAQFSISYAPATGYGPCLGNCTARAAIRNPVNYLECSVANQAPSHANLGIHERRKLSLCSTQLID
jgi:hypothetical protein